MLVMYAFARILGAEQAYPVVVLAGDEVIAVKVGMHPEAPCHVYLLSIVINRLMSHGFKGWRDWQKQRA